ncbi:MAG: PhzF family phenazine biosynthesis protein [Acidimicrobiales bacterium]|jgi:PhzF family phenazine biosynthesis protein|nr:PhzF family phenazine biosynthesis protein [Acidimicrobiales bacterium]
MQRRFVQVDVFTPERYRGNPLAVVLDADGLSDGELQRFASWTNLSETTFLLPPTDSAADYRVRIFTPASELPFAGHPTLGTCHAWLAAGGRPQRSDVVVQQCAVGLVEIRPSVEGRLAFAAPPLLRSGPPDGATLAAALRALDLGRDDVVDAAWVDNGPGWLGLLLRSADEVLALRCGPTDLDIGVVGPYPPGSTHAYEVRAFFPVGGSVVEDPVTGSLNASVAQWLVGTGRAVAPYTASQGTVLGRAGVAHVDVDDRGRVWVGGDVVTCIEGVVDL